jgi:hypothetical protein
LLGSLALRLDELATQGASDLARLVQRAALRRSNGFLLTAAVFMALESIPLNLIGSTGKPTQATEQGRGALLLAMALVIVAFGCFAAGLLTRDAFGSARRSSKQARSSHRQSPDRTNAAQ